jgi:hypothetical protein
MVDMTDSVIDFVGKRHEAIAQRKREFERILFKNFLGVYMSLEDHLKAVETELVDISDKGCLIQIPFVVQQRKKYKKDMNVHLRIYFTASAFLPVSLVVRYTSEFLDEHGKRFLRLGCEFDKTVLTYEAMESFIHFTNKFAEHSSTDKHEHRTSSLP